MSNVGAIALRKSDAATRFAAEGVPHRRIEAWHYTDLRSVLPADLKPAAPWQGAVVREGALADPFAGVDCDTLVFANGRYRPDLSRLPGEAAIQIVDLTGPLPDWAAEAFGAWRGTDEAPMADLALAQMTGGVAIRVSHNFKAARPVHLAFVHRGAADEARHVRVLLVMENHAELTLLESHAGAYVPPSGASRLSPPASGGSNGAARSNGNGGSLTNVALELKLAANVTLTHLKIANDAPHDMHIATTLGSMQANTLYDVYLAAGNGALARHETQMKLAARMARLRITGFSLLGHGQHADITAVVDHAVREGSSDLVFKKVLAGKSRGVAQGRVIVRPGADGTNSTQQTRALLLSRQAEADAKPELEIHADDVVCGHGAAIGQLDADALFYLRARGIPEGEARAMLTEAFLEEGLARLPPGPAADAMRAFVLDRLRTLEPAP